MVFSCGFGNTQLTHNNKDEFTPDYSPDGKRIVYAGLEGLERNDAESDIYTIKAGGGGKTQVTNNDNADDLQPSYSPDGKKIAYTVYKGNVIEGDIYTVKVGGGGKSKVTKGHGPSWESRP
jgi:Tol biopolymer transport system component